MGNEVFIPLSEPLKRNLKPYCSNANLSDQDRSFLNTVINSEGYGTHGGGEIIKILKKIVISESETLIDKGMAFDIAIELVQNNYEKKE